MTSNRRGRAGKRAAAEVVTTSLVPKHPDATAPRLCLGREICGRLDVALEREWLVTNGIGGYAAGTVALANTRRYHGLLVAALKPPVARTVLVAALDVVAHYAGRTYGLSTNEYHGGTINPEGYRLIESFALIGGIPTWQFAVADALVTRRVWMAHGSNTTYVEYAVDRAGAPVALELAPLCTHRDYHTHSRGGWTPGVRVIDGGFEVEAWPGAPKYRVLAPAASLRTAGDWYWNFRHRAEGERGLDDAEDLFCPGRFMVDLAPGASVTIVCTMEDAPAPAAQALTAERARTDALLAALPGEASNSIRQLALAADQFIVGRGDGGTGGQSVIAGYPWFTDWGRDTMIALPGLTTAVGRPDIAARILRTFAGHVSEGMLPNRFPDGGEAPEYNTVDATLWYFQAIADYVQSTGDLALARDLYPLLGDIVAWHQRGTRYRIHMDASDGLLFAGEPGVQLTWMDAKVGDWVVTPRIGKPVEINALWANALAVMADLARALGDDTAARRYGELAGTTAAAFRQKFWFDAGGYLYDAIDGPEADASLRPNQVFAVSLPMALLDAAQARRVVDRCGRELLTSAGLRSLAPGDQRFVGRYAGGPLERDGAYHQGTVWSWLLGPFAIAHYRVYRDREQALAWLRPLNDHLLDGCLGTVSEIFDGDAPFRPRGCFAQAWSVGEALRAWRLITTTPDTDGAMV
jgi:predicted glycogen debranching enzyme